MFVGMTSEAIEFIQEAQMFLDADPANVIAIHCKGGKGRTGTLICMLLINNNVFESAKVYVCLFSISANLSFVS